MILDTWETAGNTTSSNKWSKDTNTSEENEFRESEQLHELKLEIGALKLFILEQFNFLKQSDQKLKD